MKRKQPNPGSDAAVAKGCKCPILDNAHGKGYMGSYADKDGPIFVMMKNCPLHGMKLKQPQKKKKFLKSKQVCDCCGKPGGQLGTCPRESIDYRLHHKVCCIRKALWVPKGEVKRHRHRYIKVCSDCGKHQ